MGVFSRLDILLTLPPPPTRIEAEAPRAHQTSPDHHTAYQSHFLPLHTVTDSHSGFLLAQVGSCAACHTGVVRASKPLTGAEADI